MPTPVLPTPTPFKRVTTASTNVVNVKNGAATLVYLSAYNPTATPAYLKVYDLAGSPNLATATPDLVIPLFNLSRVVEDLGPLGDRFNAGISIAVTGAVAANDTTAAVAGIYIKLDYI